MSNDQVVFQKPKKPRNELRLPILYYVVADDWIEKLGNDAFIAWLRFHTWVDRTDEQREYDKIPYSLEDTWKKLGMGKTKFYEKVIRPLWNHGLIDIIEYTASKRNSQKPKNIIVYESPMDLHETLVKPLEQIRNYDTDYNSSSQIFGKKGGRRQSQSGDSIDIEEDLNDLFGDDNPDRSQIRTVENDGSEMRTVDGSEMRTVDGSEMRTVTVHEREPNNYTNISNNVLNGSNNESNSSINETNNNKGNANVVVVEKLFKKYFDLELSALSTKKLVNALTTSKMDLEEVIQDSIVFAFLKNEPMINPVGAVIHGLANGWDLTSLLQSYLKEQTLPPKKKINTAGMPKAVAKQLEQEQNGETESTMSPEELAQRQAEIKEKMRLMNEKLANRGNGPEQATG